MLDQLKQNKQRYRRWRMILLVCSVMLLGLATYEVWHHWIRDNTTCLRISAGPLGTRRHDLVAMLQQAVLPSDLHFTVVPTAGSEEAIKLVNSGELDLAVVSSGIESQGKEQVRELAALPVEPAHLLLKKELVKQPGTLREVLQGKRVNVGVPGSSSYALAREILIFTTQHVGHPDAGLPFELTHLSIEELIAQADGIRQASVQARADMINSLPDAILLVVSMPSKVAQVLIETAGYQLVPLPFSRAFIAHNMKGEGPLNSLIDHSYMEQVVIPAGSYLGTMPLPEKDCETIGLRLLLIANRNVPVRDVFRVMTGLFEGEYARRIKPLDPETQPSPYPLHLGAKAYLQRNKPYLHELLEWGRKIMSALGLFSAGAFSLYALLRTRRQKSASDYLLEIQRIDELAREIMKQQPTAAAIETGSRALDERLTAIKSELIQACCKKTIKNEMTLLNILTVLGDTRNQVAVMMKQSQVQMEAGALRRAA